MFISEYQMLILPLPFGLLPPELSRYERNVKMYRNRNGYDSFICDSNGDSDTSGSLRWPSPSYLSRTSSTALKLSP